MYEYFIDENCIPYRAKKTKKLVSCKNIRLLYLKENVYQIMQNGNVQKYYTDTSQTKKCIPYRTKTKQNYGNIINKKMETEKYRNA